MSVRFLAWSLTLFLAGGPALAQGRAGGSAPEGSARPGPAGSTGDATASPAPAEVAPARDATGPASPAPARDATGPARAAGKPEPSEAEAAPRPPKPVREAAEPMPRGRGTVDPFNKFPETSGRKPETPEFGTTALPVPESAVPLGYRTVVVSSLWPESLLESPRSVDVLTLLEMEHLIGRTTPEMLEYVPGVLVQKTNHGGGSAFIRGMTGQHVLYLIDGIRLNNSTTRYGPNQMLNTVDPYSLSRIEVLRGPGSLFYGSDALGGVISMAVRLPPFVPGARLRWGGFSAARFSTADTSQVYDAMVWGQWNRLAGLVGGSFKDFGNLVAGRGIGEQKWTGYWEGDYHGAVVAWLGGDWMLRVVANGVRQFDVPRTDKCKPTDFRYYRNQFRDLVYAKLAGRHGRYLDRFEAALAYQRHYEFRQRYRLAKDRIQDEEDTVHTVGGYVQGRTDLGRYSRLTYGFDIYHDWVGSIARRESISTGLVTPMDGASFRGRFVDGSRYLQGGVFVADELRPLDWLFLRFGARLAFSHASIPKDPLAESMGLQAGPIDATFWGPVLGGSAEFIPLKQLRVILSVQQGYRAPNLDDYSHLGSEGGGFDVPSPGLEDAEKSTTLELGLKWATRRVTAWAFGYYSFLRDFITRVEAGYDVEGEPATVRKNAASGYIAGVEAYGKVLLGKGFGLQGWISWTQGDLEIPLYDPPTQPMRRIPPLQGLVGVTYSGRRWWAELDVRWAARQDRLAPGDLRDKRICPDGPDRCDGTPGFAILNLLGGVRLNKYVDLTARIDNIGNAPYKYHGSGVYGAGLSGIVELRIRK